MKDYENSVQVLNEMKTENAVEEKIEMLSEDEQKLLGILENILNSEVLYVEDKESGSALVLSSGVNTKVFETVAQTSYSLVNELLQEEDDGADDSEEDDSEEDEPDEDEADESEEDESEEDEADEEEADEADEAEANESAFESEEDKEACQEAILGLLDSEVMTIKSDLEGPGFTVNENSPYFDIIKESLIERLIDTCDSEEEFEVCEKIVQAYEGDVLESAGYGVDDTAEELNEETEETEELKEADLPAKPEGNIIKRKGKLALSKVKGAASAVKGKATEKGLKYKLIKKVPTKAAKQASAIQWAKTGKGGGGLVAMTRGKKVAKIIPTKKGVAIAGGTAAGLAAVGYGVNKLRQKLKKKRSKNEQVATTALDVVEASLGDKAIRVARKVKVAMPKIKKGIAKGARALKLTKGKFVTTAKGSKGAGGVLLRGPKGTILYGPQKYLKGLEKKGLAKETGTKLAIKTKLGLGAAGAYGVHKALKRADKGSVKQEGTLGRAVGRAHMQKAARSAEVANMYGRSGLIGGTLNRVVTAPKAKLKGLAAPFRKTTKVRGELQKAAKPVKQKQKITY